MRGPTLFIFILNEMEQSSLRNQLDLNDPRNNVVNGLAAMVLPVIVCPSDIISANPVSRGNPPYSYGVTSYGGSGGTGGTAYRSGGACTNVAPQAAYGMFFE